MVQNMTSLSVLIGNNIRQQRKAQKINQENLALLAGIDRSYMGRIERGEVNLTVDKLYRISQILQCEAYDLLPPHAYLISHKAT